MKKVWWIWFSAFILRINQQYFAFIWIELKFEKNIYTKKKVFSNESSNKAFKLSKSWLVAVVFSLLLLCTISKLWLSSCPITFRARDFVTFLLCTQKPYFFQWKIELRISEEIEAGPVKLYYSAICACIFISVTTPGKYSSKLFQGLVKFVSQNDLNEKIPTKRSLTTNTRIGNETDAPTEMDFFSVFSIVWANIRRTRSR